MGRNMDWMIGVAALLILLSVLVFVALTGQNNDEGVEMILSENTVIAQAVVDDNGNAGWGYFQFPKLYFTEDQTMVCKIANKPDLTQSYSGDYVYCLSRDGGATWEQVDDEPVDYSLRLQNGRYFQGPVLVDGWEPDFEDRCVPRFVSWDGTRKLYCADDLPEGAFPETFACEEYDPVSGELSTFECRLNWPCRPVIVRDGLVLPAGVGMYHFCMHSAGMIYPKDNGDLLMALYSMGFDEETGEVACGGQYNVYFFESRDSARTWDYVSQILTEPDYCTEDKDGFSEPNILRIGEGEYCIIMRTGAMSPSYIAYSHDDGRTWVDLQEFDDIGVDPQLLRLDCGVTLASYGRPDNYIRMTDDPTCLMWEAPAQLDERGRWRRKKWWQRTCSYTSMLPLDAETVIIAYSDFQYSNAEDDSTVVKTILARRISVTS